MNKITRNISAILTIGLGSTLIANAQVTSQKIGTNPTMKQTSAVLEVESNNKGILMPRIALTGLTDALTITSPANSLTVFNTATAGTTPDNVTPGYYYWSTAENKWIRLLNQNDAAEPWQVQTTTNKATSNTQNIYQMGSVAVGKNVAETGVNLDVAGAIRGGSGNLGTVGVNSVAFGTGNTATGQGSFAVGSNNNANNQYSRAMGISTTASGLASTAIGNQATAGGAYSLSSGNNTVASGSMSTALGNANTASGTISVAIGNNLIASSLYEVTLGYWNAITTPVSPMSMFQIGNGSSANRKNALTILQNGNTAIGVAGTEAAAKPTELLDLGGTATAGLGGLKIRNINSAAYTGNTATDKVVVADAAGVLKTVATDALTVEPWQVQAGSTKASVNVQNIYQTGSVAVGDFSTAASTKKMEVKGDFKAEVTAAGGVAYGTEISHPVNPNGAMHYWLTSPTNYRIASANAQGAILQGVSGTTTNTVAASDIKSEMSSLNGSNSLSAVRAENTGNFFMESYNVTGNFGSTISLQNDGLRLRHTNTNGAADPFPLNNSSEIFVQKTNGVRFNFRDAAAVQTGEYWFPTTTGTAGQVMTQTATGKMVWSNPALSVAEVDGVIGNEVTNATVNGGLTRDGAGTNVSPYTLGLTPGSATGNVMTWNGTVWNPANPVNIYNADGSLTGTGNRTLTLNSKTLNFDGTDRRTYWDSEGRIHQRATNTALDAAMGFHNSGANLWIQQWSAGSAITASDNSTSLSLGTHFTQVAAPIIFNTSIGANTTGVERMRITGVGKIGMGTFTPSEQLDNTGITRLRTLPLNGAANAINTTATGDESPSQDQTFTATRTVVADANGVLGTVAGLPATSVNIYNANGTLTANRTVNMASNDLTFSTAGNGSIQFSTDITGIASQNIIGTTTRGNLTLTGGSATVDLYVDNGGVAQLTSRGNSTGLNVGTTTGQTTPLKLVTNGLPRVTVTPNGEVAIGAATAPSFTIGSGATAQTIQPKLHVAGDISTTGKVWTTNSVYADYVFEKYFKGHSHLNKDYKFNSLEEVSDFIKENHHLPGVTKIDDLGKSENGYTFDMTALSIQQLEKIEELFLHTIEQQEQLKTQYEVNEKQQEIILQQQDELKQLKERMEKLEQLLITKQ